ncbi:hypothetical protein LCGC14_2705840 [marine sediment metagenome]|uniref:Uncharacterized protein n=1 Tax=marine sediment metagenome TaxID=412755 RepID=A0A0F8ZEA7_9ZZZZ
MIQCDKCDGIGEVYSPLSEAIEKLVDTAAAGIEHVGTANYVERISEAHDWVHDAAQNVRKLLDKMEEQDVYYHGLQGSDTGHGR